jgi:asparagine synthase (glutamine-hydrolysing)
MCGISGTVSLKVDGFTDEAILKQMCRTMRHRGPDDEGYYLDHYVGLGMRRLSIIDLESGQQPVTNEDESLWLIFNGEIYNYRELRRRLEQRGHIFRSHSDTEVIVHAYEEYGERCVEHFIGMFGIALWDKNRRRLFIARDRLGIKPLYYWSDGVRFAFGSELKVLVAHPEIPLELDLVALDQFLTLEYIPSPRTIFQNIHKLPAGHTLFYENGEVTVKQYWNVPPREVPKDDASCVEELEALIRDAVQLRLVSDVPLGAFLSGGIDSSTVVAFMSEAMSTPVQTFSIGFGDKTYNELPYARMIARHFGTDHYEEYLEPDIASLAERLVRHLDEPFGDFSIFPTYLVSEVASRSVKVVLSGDGGDEVFGGYETYVAQSLDRLYRVLPSPLRRSVLPALMSYVPPQRAKKGVINKAKRFIEGAALPPSLQHTRWMMFMNEQDKQQLYESSIHRLLNGDTAAALMESYFGQLPHADPLVQQQYVDLKTYLVDDILTKVDRMSMAASIEARVPLLDHRVVEFALSLPPHLKLHRGQTKVILRRVMANRIPEAVLNKPKEGFSIPLKHWLCGPLRPMMEELLSPESIRRRGLFQANSVGQWISAHLSGQANHSHRLWALMVFELWYRSVLDARVTNSAIQKVQA